MNRPSSELSCNISSMLLDARLIISAYSAFSSSPTNGVHQRGIGVERGVLRGVVRGVATGDASRPNAVGLITPLSAVTGLMLG